MVERSTLAIALGALALFALLSASALYLYFQNLSLDSKLSELSQKQAESQRQIELLQSDYAALQSSHKQTVFELSRTSSNLSASLQQISVLEQQLSEKERLLAESKTSLELQQQKAQEIATELSSLEQNINDSFSWFRENAALPENYSWAGDIFLTRVQKDCVDKNELNLACISYLMENTAFSVHYRLDIEAGKLDFLQSVKQTIDLGWGDCEDYSLIFKATINSARAKVRGLQAVAFTSGGTGNFRVYPKESIPVSDTDSFWYVPNSKKAPIGELDSSHAYVICFRSSQTSGHCTVAISPNKIESSSQVGLLEGAQVFEPQNGFYLGEVGQEFSICDSSLCTRTVRAIQLVISDDDLYKYENGGWIGYADYVAKVRQAKAELAG